MSKTQNHIEAANDSTAKKIRFIVITTFNGDGYSDTCINTAEVKYFASVEEAIAYGRRKAKLETESEGITFDEETKLTPALGEVCYFVNYTFDEEYDECSSDAGSVQVVLDFDVPSYGVELNALVNDFELIATAQEMNERFEDALKETMEFRFNDDGSEDDFVAGEMEEARQDFADGHAFVDHYDNASHFIKL